MINSYASFSVTTGDEILNCIWITVLVPWSSFYATGTFKLFGEFRSKISVKICYVSRIVFKKLLVILTETTAY